MLFRQKQTNRMRVIDNLGKAYTVIYASASADFCTTVLINFALYLRRPRSPIRLQSSLVTDAQLHDARQDMKCTDKVIICYCILLSHRDIRFDPPIVLLCRLDLF